MAEAFLNDITIIEFGRREAVGKCGSALAELGARVILIEFAQDIQAGTFKWHDRAQAAAGKTSIVVDAGSPEDRALLEGLLQSAHVVITSSDVDQPAPTACLDAFNAQGLRCDITAFGASGPMRGHAYGDALIQAYAGGMWVTGATDAAPTYSKCRYVDSAAGAWAAGAILAGLKVRRQTGIGQDVGIALFDCAIAMNTTFLSQYFAGMEAGRIGNRHVSMSPWNAYRAKDGWVVLCTGSNDQWRRVCRIIGDESLAADDLYDTPQKRVAQWQAVDRIVESWTRGQTVEHCITAFNEVMLPCGPVYTLDTLFTDPSLRQRGIFLDATDPVTSSSARIAGPVFRGSAAAARPRLAIPAPDSGRRDARPAAPQPAPPACAGQAPLSARAGQAPLQGLRVIEIGSYTTAPLCARQLGALGADVVKLESPAGDPARQLPPLRYGQGIFFSIGNSDKRAVQLDLKTDEGLAHFHDLLKQADVFVENLRPGALSQLGLSPAQLHELNPRLVYCSITGFGIASPYAKRAAMDTTIQAMSGIMDLTRSVDSPMPNKVGISIADVMGGLYGLAAILAALEYRDRHGEGQWVDLSMQDIAATLTQDSWNRPVPDCLIVQCSDGYVVADVDPRHAPALLPEITPRDAGPATCACTRLELVAAASGRGVLCAPVNSITEALDSEQAKERGLVVAAVEGGRDWELLASPIKLSRTPAVVQRAIGPLGEYTQEVLKEWLGIEECAHIPTPATPS